MLDRKFVLENAELVQQNCTNRNIEVDVSRFVSLEGERKELQAQVEELNRKANEVSKSIGKAKDQAEREERIAEGRRLREEVAAHREKLGTLTEELDAIHRMMPNLSHPDVPVGKDDKSNLEIAKGATPVPEFDFEPLDHVDLGEKLDLMDFEGGARVAGHGFYFLKRDAVLLELALQQYAIGLLVKVGLRPDHHARPGPKRGPRRGRLHSARSGDADL